MSIQFSRQSKTETETDEIAIEFSKLLKPGMVISLIGNLGAGKTYFIKRVLEQFNVNNANSPTFSIVNEYDGKYKFYHFDFYRINSESELIDIGIEDYFNYDNSISFIEWADMFPNIIPRKRIEIKIQLIDEDLRQFDFNEYE